jgi:hypothetical protein
MENRIEEQQLDLFADRTSTATMVANQLRLWFSSFAYVVMAPLRRIGLSHTEFETATCGTIRLKLLKIGARGRSQDLADERQRRGGGVAIALFGDASRDPRTLRGRWFMTEAKRTQGAVIWEHPRKPRPTAVARLEVAAGRGLAQERGKGVELQTRLICRSAVLSVKFSKMVMIADVVAPCG